MRPPRPAGPRRPVYITPQGAERLRAELQHLWTVERPLVTSAVHEAAKNGDRSENGDYIYGKRRLREIDRRVRYLGKRLDGVTVVSAIPQDRGRVFFGAWVTLEDEAGAETRYRIVGPDEADVAAGSISMDSPLARALLGKRLDDEVEVRTPGGLRHYAIVAIDYLAAGACATGAARLSARRGSSPAAAGRCRRDRRTPQCRSSSARRRSRA